MHKDGALVLEFSRLTEYRCAIVVERACRGEGLVEGMAVGICGPVWA